MSKIRVVSQLSLPALLAVPLLINCSGGLGSLGGVASASCPADILSVKSIQDAKFGLAADLEANAKASLQAGALVAGIAAEMEAEVLTACTNIAKDLGVPSEELKPKDKKPGAKVEAACAAAAKAIGAVRATVKGDFQVKAEPPVCHADMNAMAKCAGECDANIEPGSAKVECEGGKLSGKCSGECKGSCTVDAGAECSGTCSGKCEGTCSADVSGACSGTCEGKCDGKNTSGKCAGKCEGKCKAEASASCSGTCEGKCDASCEVEAKGQCQGTCSGECSVEFEAPQCEGEVKPPEMSVDCQAKCEAEITAEVECKPAQINIDGNLEANTEQVTALIATLEANLPVLIKVAGAMKARAETVVASSKASVDGMYATIQAGGTETLSVVGCFASSIDAQAQASAKISVSVEASASVSGSASGST